MLRFGALIYIMAVIGTANVSGSERLGASLPEARFATATCSEAILGNPEAGRGPIRFFDYARALEAAVKGDGGLWTVKLGAAVRGDAPVTVRVVPRQQGQAALHYGLGASASKVRFEPCPDHRTSTGWAGGVKLVERKPVTVEIRARGKKPIREVLLDRKGPPLPSG